MNFQFIYYGKNMLSGGFYDDKKTAAAQKNEN
jgi:hypothetical protein